MTDTDPGEILGTSEAPPEPIEFLVGSWNRFRVLDALGTTSRTREELVEATDVSRPTLSRILSDLTDHGWIRRHNDEYEATPKGKVIASGTDQFVDNVETAEKLDTALEWIRTDLLGFDLRHLADAEVLTPDPQDYTGPSRRLAEHIATTTQVRVVATGVTYEVVVELCRAGVDGDLTLRCILDEHAFEGIYTHTDLREMFHEMIESGQAEVYRYLGTDDLLDINLVDDAVMLCGHSDDGPPPGIVLSDDETIRSWTEYYFETLHDDSELLQANSFTA